MDFYLLIIFICLLFSAFFSGSEIAFYQANRLKIELDKNRGQGSAKILSSYITQPSRFITNTLLGNNIALVIYGVMFTKLFTQYDLLSKYLGIESHLLSFLILTIVSAFIVLLLAEYLPKALFSVNPNNILRVVIYPFHLIYLLLFPVNFLINSISVLFLRLFRVKISEDKQTFDSYDLFHFVADDEDAKAEESDIELDTQILKNAIELPNVKVRECMIPRPEIVSVELDEDISVLKEKFVESGLSKIIIFKETIDQVIGYVHMIDLYENPDTIKKILRPVVIIAESMPANELLKQFTSTNRSIGLVVDEYGGTAGIVSIEDVLEEIFGEIEDEYDSEGLKEVKVNEQEYIFSARLEIDYLNKKYGFNLPEGDFETLSGLILDNHQNIPQKNHIVKVERFSFKIHSATRSRIDEVIMTIHNSQD